MEIKKRINEEIDDAECKCFTGETKLKFLILTFLGAKSNEI